MAESFAPAIVIGGPGDVLPVKHGDDSAFNVEFYTREIEDHWETRMRGRQILKPVTYCRKQAVGDPRTVWDQPASDEDKARWPQQWAAFQAGEQQAITGTPLEAVPWLTANARVTLKNHGFKTIEQLATVSDGTLSTMQHGMAPLLQNVREHARKFMADQEAGSAERRLVAELEQRDGTIETLQNQIAALSQQMERMRAEQLAAPIVQPEETAPSAQQIAQAAAPVPPQPVPDPGIAALETLPVLEAADPEPSTDTPVAGNYSVKRGFHEFQVLGGAEQGGLRRVGSYHHPGRGRPHRLAPARQRDREFRSERAGPAAIPGDGRQGLTSGRPMLVHADP